ncbi:MAG TPA: zinc ABC transporter substrate-binding protein [Firmicutes bacterium]|nr:zinc ABC transporter substrate-binding protein [Bacillota bacterium]
MRKLLVTVFLLAVGLLIPGCHPLPQREQTASITVVSTIFPVSDILCNLAGDTVAVSSLLPPGASPHTFEPSIDQVKSISSARLLVCVGAGLDSWSLKLADATEPPILIIELASLANLETNLELGTDPHFWLDPLIVRDTICPLLAKELTNLLPEKKDEIQSNLNCYQGELTALDQEIRSVTTAFRQRKFISLHAAWKYFARRYDLEEVEVVTGSPGQEPSAGWVTEIIDTVINNNVGAIFAEPQLSLRLAERIAEETGAKLFVLDPLGGPQLPGRGSYLDLMRYNLNIFKAALN